MPRRKYSPLDPAKDLSDSAKRKIEAARARAVSNLLEKLRLYWEQFAGSAATLRSRDPFEVVPLFDLYAETQYDAYAQELLNQFSDVDMYCWHLKTAVTDSISGAILPGGHILADSPFGEEWVDISAHWGEVNPEIKTQLVGLSSTPSGAWESYLQKSFELRMLQGKVKSHSGESRAAAAALFRLLFAAKYQFYLRPFLNQRKFDLRLRAYLETRLAHWRAEALARIAAPPPGSQLGRNIDERRKECGWTFEELAEELKLAKTSVLAHVHKGARPRPDALNAYAQLFSIKLGREITVSELEGYVR